MKAAIGWALRNRPAMNTIMLGVLVLGGLCLARLQRERFPDFRPDEVLVEIQYPGASPAEVEQAICLRVEEALQPIVGVAKITSIAEEGRARITAELASSVRDPQRVVNDAESAVARIRGFPDEIERPVVRMAVRFRRVVSLGVLGPPQGSEDALRTLTETVRSELLQLPAVSHVDLWHAKPYQIDVELSEQQLRRYKLTHEDVARAIRSANREIPGGDIRTAEGDLLVRVSDRQLTGAGIARIPVRTRADGVALTVGDLARVRDGLDETEVFARLQGRPALSMEVRRTPDQDMLEIQQQVVAYAAAKSLPAGYELLVWNDYSTQARDRIDLLSRNAVTGLLLVFAALALFLDLRLAFWVAMGIPVSVLGACAVMAACGATLNMHSMFAFVMALGIVVDDAIVVSENVYRHRRLGKSGLQAALDGAAEVAPSVTSSVLTTVIAFLPLAFVSGEMGKWISVIPLALISMLLISLLEGLFILPGHLAHLEIAERPGWIERLQAGVQGWVDRGIERLYLPLLRWGLRLPELVIAGSFAALCLVGGLYLGGYTPLVTNQSLDYAFVYAYVEYPKGTPTPMIDAATQRMERTLRQVQPEEAGRPSLVSLIYRGVGYTTQLSNRRGEVYAELDPTRAFDATSSREIVSRWREQAGPFPGAERVIFWGLNNAPGGKPIELAFRSSSVEQLEQVADAVKQRLRGYAGVRDISDSRGPGKWELKMKLKPQAARLGVRLEEIGRTVRAAYYGEEVMRLQRGRHEVKVMVRYSQRERRRRASLEEIRVRTESGNALPLPAVAHIEAARGFSQILRIDGQRAVTITADVDESVGNAAEIAGELEGSVLPELLREAPEVRTRWEGQQRETRRSLNSLAIGFAVALFGMFALLTLEFRSYAQPLIILAIIPFGVVGAVAGHFALGQPLTLFSLFGIVTLSGVVANDSIVLVDFINRRRVDGVPLDQALVDAGRVRFRPVMLTTVTTIAALLPILWERNTQAQVVIPMAVSIAAGLLSATIWVLLLGPILYQAYAWLLPDDGRPEQ